jgi:RNA polymerase sigma-54 factor
MRGQLRLEQKMKLAPHMIQSMEILQLPILALQERIEQELNANPVLEIDESKSQAEVAETPETAPAEADYDAGPPGEQAADFHRVENLDEEVKDYVDRSGDFTPRPRRQETDAKLEAMKNTAAPAQSLHDYLQDQWRLIDAADPVKVAGSLIIDYLDLRGYLSVRLEQLHNKDRKDFSLDALQAALPLVQQLDPPGVGARDLRECLLIQIDQSGDDLLLERRIIANHLDDLLDNKLPDIARKLKCSIDDVNTAIARLSKFDTSPGLRIGPTENHHITADVMVEYSEELDDYVVTLADTGLPSLRVNDYYTSLLKDSSITDKTREFLQSNVRSAQWIIDAIQQRKNTLLRVTTAIVKHQRDFFDKGKLHLKPLPMQKIADEVGVHIATVSRAVAGKYVQCSWGILPLRGFFSGGVEDVHGNEKSYDAVREKMKQIIDNEDKGNPLNDDEIKLALAEAGIGNIARRTVAKYRKLLNIPTARLRKKY